MNTLYLIRHARAAERGKRWPDDRLRPLTADGVRRMERAVDGLVTLGFEVDLLLTSAFVRARDTARIVSKRTPGRPRLQEVEWLEPEVPTARSVRGLAAFGAVPRLALVGHEPGIGELAAWMIDAQSPLPFRKGAVACFEVAAWPPVPPVALRWFAPARLLGTRPKRRR